MNRSSSGIRIAPQATPWPALRRRRVLEHLRGPIWKLFRSVQNVPGPAKISRRSLGSKFLAKMYWLYACGRAEGVDQHLGALGLGFVLQPLDVGRGLAEDLRALGVELAISRFDLGDVSSRWASISAAFFLPSARMLATFTFGLAGDRLRRDVDQLQRLLELRLRRRGDRSSACWSARARSRCWPAGSSRAARRSGPCRVVSLIVMLRISASRTWMLRRRDLLLERRRSARPGTCCASSPWISSLARVLAPSFWHAAFIAGSITLLRTVSVSPMLATISGASAGVLPQTTVKSASTW